MILSHIMNGLFELLNSFYESILLTESPCLTFKVPIVNSLGTDPRSPEDSTESSGQLSEVSRFDFERVFFLGNGALYGYAAESHLKLQELCAGRIICRSDSFLGLRHGPEAAIDDRTLVVCFVSTDPYVRRYEVDLMRDIHVKGIGVNKIAVCSKSG